MELLPGCFGTFDEFDAECCDCDVNVQCKKFESLQNPSKFVFLEKFGDELKPKCKYSIFIEFCNKIGQKKKIKRKPSLRKALIVRKRLLQKTKKRMNKIVRNFIQRVKVESGVDILDKSEYIVPCGRLYFNKRKKSECFVVRCKKANCEDLSIFSIAIKNFNKTYDVRLLLTMRELKKHISKKDLKILKFINSSEGVYKTFAKDLDNRKLSVFRKIIVSLFKKQYFDLSI